MRSNNEVVIQNGKFSGYSAQLEPDVPVNNGRWDKLTVTFPPIQFKREYFISPESEVFKSGRAIDFSADYGPRVQNTLSQLAPSEAEYILEIRGLFTCLA